MMFVIFLLGAFIGVGVGFAFALIGQIGIEAGYKKTGIAKIDGEWYKITKIDVNEGDAE